MLVAPIPLEEEQRLEELEHLALLDRGPEEVFDRVTERLAGIFDVPFSTMSIITRDTQYFKSQFGLAPKTDGDGLESAALIKMPRELSICGHVVAGNELLAVDDLSLDTRFADNPMVRESGARFYAGAPLRGDSGQAIGSLCIVDTKPRHLSERETQLLQLVADGLMNEVKLRKLSRELHAISHRLTERHRRNELELIQARHVQRFLLPPSQHEAPRYGISHLYEPVQHIGGDFVDMFVRDDQTLMLLLADVSGHGASAAMTSAMTKTSFLRAAPHAAGPAQLLTIINRELSPVAADGHFMTALAAHYDPGAGALMLASAGHPHPILVRNAVASVVELESDFPLFLDAAAEYGTSHRIQLAPGDRVILYTDGAHEAVNGAGQLLGVRRLLRCIEAAARLRGSAMLRAVFDQIADFAAGHHLTDDVAMLAIEVR